LFESVRSVLPSRSRLAKATPLAVPPVEGHLDDALVALVVDEDVEGGQR